MARTLLLNLAQERPNEEVGDEVVDSSFRPVRESPGSAAVRTALLGSNPDKLTANFRMAQAMRLLHADPVARQHVLALSPNRVTYVGSEALFDIEPAVTVRTIAADTITVSAEGSPSGDQVRGRNLRHFSLDLRVTLATAFATFSQLSGGVEGRDQPSPSTLALVDQDVVPFTLPSDPGVVFTVTNLLLGESALRNGENWMPLGNSSTNPLVANFNEGQVQYEPRFLVTMKSRPAGSIADIGAKFEEMQAAALDFDLPNTEPYKTFRAMAAEGQPRVRRTCGVLLLAIYSNHQAYLRRG